MGKIRSRLVTFTVNAKDRATGEVRNWTIQLQGNRIREDQADWLKGAMPSFADIKLTKVTAASKRHQSTIRTKAEIAAQGLALLDEILASRK